MQGSEIHEHLERIREILDSLNASQSNVIHLDDLTDNLRHSIDTIEKLMNKCILDEENYRRIIEKIQDVYYRADLEGNLIMASPSIEKTLGYSPESIIGSNIAEVFYKNPDKRQELMDQLEKEDEVQNYEVILIHKDGTPIPILSSSHFIYDKKGDRIGIEGTFTDITERKKAEEALRESEEKFRSVVENAPIGIFIVNDRFQFIYANEMFGSILGYSQEEIPGKDFRDHLDEESKQIVTDRYIKRQNGEKITPKYEIRAIHKSGKTILLEIRVSVITTKDGQRRTIGQVLDITEQRKNQIQLRENEEKLKASEEKFRTLTNQLPVGVYRTTQEGTFIYFNSQLTSMLGYDNNELYDISVPDLYVDKNDRDWGIEYLKKNPEGVQQREIKLMTKQGSIIIVNDTINVTMDQQGNIKYFDGVLEDITDRKKTETALRESEEKFRKLAHTTSTAILLYQDEKWIYANPAAERISGYTEKELKQMKYWEFVAPEHQEIIKTRGKERQSGKKVPSGYEFKIITKKGEAKWVYLEGSLMEYHGKPAGLISVIDISHLKKIEETLLEKNNELLTTEEELIASNDALRETNEKLEEQKESLKKAKEKAEESDRLKTTFLANMSHEIRTPINGIVGFTQLLKEQEYSEQERDEFYEIIDANSRQLLQIINDIIDISKIEVNQLRIKKSAFSLNKLLDEVADIGKMELRIHDKEQIHISIKKTLKDGQEHIKTDNVRLKQILTNLLHNSIKFTDEGTIEIGYKKQPGQKLLFYIKDTGIGIPANKQKIIFDHFRRAHESKSSKYGGTGLGLSISKRLVELLGGEIWLSSKEKMGTSFYFTLPFHQETTMKKTPEARKEKNYSWEGKNILVVEDDPSSQRFIAETLKNTGVKLIVKDNGPEGLKAYKQTSQLAIVLLDIKLPGKDGLTIAREMKAHKKNIPIIATTAFAMDNDKKSALDAGCDAYITKPLDKKELFSIMDQLLDKE